MFAEGTGGYDGALENDAWLRHRGATTSGSPSRTDAWFLSTPSASSTRPRGRRYLVRARRDPPPRLLRRHWTNWTSVRKVKEGETASDLYTFLTTEPNAEVGAFHPKAMPVILTTPDKVETWMNASPGEALRLQRPLPDGTLRVVARGVKEDSAAPAA